MLSYIKVRLQLILVGLLIVLGVIAKYFASRTTKLEEDIEVQKVLMEYNARNDLLRKEFMYNRVELEEQLRESRKILNRRIDEIRKASINDNRNSYDISV